MLLPSKAFILAAGFGTRMRPISWVVPKPLLPLWNTPLVLRQIRQLSAWGVRDVLVNLHHGADAVLRVTRRSVADAGLPVRLNFSFESSILGTGGALRRAAWFFDDDPFWLVNADTAARVHPHPFLTDFARHRPLAVLWMEPAVGPRTVEVQDDRVVSFHSRRAGKPGTFTFTGLHLASPRLLDFLPDRPFSSVLDGYEAAMRAGLTVRGVTPKGAFWRDLGSPAQYLEAHRAWAAHARHCGPGSPSSAVAPTAAIGPRTRIENSVVMDNTRVGAGVCLRDAVVAPGTDVRTSLEGPVVAVGAVRNDWPALGWACDALGWKESDAIANALAPRGSDRAFTRLLRGSRSAILIEYGDRRPENAAYAAHARFLRRAGIRVPTVLADWPDRHALLMEDAGSRSLEDAVPHATPARVERLYREVLDQAARLHAIPAARIRAAGIHLQPAFSPKVYRWERNLFAAHFLGPRLELSARQQALVLRDLARIARDLASAPAVLVHRDFQSSNVFLHRGETVLIDFQGMRMGPAAYDVASLLCDPYVMLSDVLRDRLLDHYLDRVRDPESVRRYFWMAAVERLAQALGAFGRLSASADTARFARYIPPALRVMQSALAHLPPLPNLALAVRVGAARWPA
jgi:NDP-sugar pyrophosphorylase family protein/aminoglycoside/choline kinase family phosphotransferase